MGGWKKAAQWEEERKNREGRSGGEEGREGDAAGEWVEAPINLNLKDVRRGRHERQPAFAGPREERGALGEERDGWEGEKRSLKMRWESWAVKRHHCRSTVHLLIRSSRVVFLPEPPEKKRMKGGKKEKKTAVLCFSFSFSFFVCLLPTCEVRNVWERSSWAHHTRDERIQFAESLSCQRTSAATFSGRQELSRDLRAASRGAEAASNAGEAWDLVFAAAAHLCRQLFYRKILWKRRILERWRVCKHVLTSGEGRRLSRQLSSWHPELRMGCWNQDLQESRCGLGDEFRGGLKEGWGFSGWEGKKGLPLPRGTSACLHRHLPVNMQVLQIVKELVSPSRRRAAARFGGVCVCISWPIKLLSQPLIVSDDRDLNQCNEDKIKSTWPNIILGQKVRGEPCECLQTDMKCMQVFNLVPEALL